MIVEIPRIIRVLCTIVESVYIYLDIIIETSTFVEIISHGQNNKLRFMRNKFTQSNHIQNIPRVVLKFKTIFFQSKLRGVLIDLIYLKCCQIFGQLNVTFFLHNLPLKTLCSQKYNIELLHC